MSVFANGREVSGKATPNKSFAAFPDVCMSPPSPPTGPTPVTYVVCGVAKDTANGTSSVFIKGKEVGKKNATKYSKVTGDQPATRNFGAGIISHNIVGALKFASYSNDVFFEKGGANRFLDLTTLNHANNSNGTTTNNFAEESQSEPPSPLCVGMQAQLKRDRENVERNRQNFLKTLTRKKDRESFINALFRGAMAMASIGPLGPVFGTNNTLFSDAAGSQYPTDIPDKWRIDPEKDKRLKMTPVQSKACKGTIKHKNSRYGRHAEMNILEKIDWSDENKPPFIIFSINWPARDPKGEEQQTILNRPCIHCKETLQKVCKCMGNQVYVCNPFHNTKESQCK